MLDGRSDLWSIGVILYELLTGRRPFGGATHAEVFEEVKRRDPKPPRQIRPDIPAELERICLKCLEKATNGSLRLGGRAAGGSGGVVATDVPPPPRTHTRRCPTAGRTTSLAPTPTSSQAAGSTAVSAAHQDPTHSAPPRIVPKGLRSFDEHDADFFLELLPGPRDRDGLPESIRFWKLRIEETDPDKTFRVGLIYGPSGCGKSSW